MPVSINEAKLVGSIDQHEQVTLTNTTGAALVKNEVFSDVNAQGDRIAYVAQGAIADGADGEACLVGEFDFAKDTSCLFNVQDEIYWHVSANQAVTRALAKVGDFFVGYCTQNAATSAEWVRGRLDKPGQAYSISTSSSISVSVSSESESSSSTSGSSTSTSVSSTSSSSTSATSKSSSSSSLSLSSNSDSTSSSLSISSISDSSSSTSQSISSNSDSSASSSSTSVA